MAQLANLEFKDPDFIMRCAWDWLSKWHEWFGQPNNV